MAGHRMRNPSSGVMLRAIAIHSAISAISAPPSSRLSRHGIISFRRLWQVLFACLLIFAIKPVLAQAADRADPLDADVRAAFLYAYPYYEFMWLRDQALHNPDSPTSTRLNLLRHQRHLATPEDRWANGPIYDTFYSTSWLDVGRSPVLLHLPDTDDRYYVVVLIGADTNSFAYLGRRSTGTKARTVAIVGPDWNGPVPAADQTIRAPTRDLYVNMRVLVRTPDDIAQVHQLQDKFVFHPARNVPADEPRILPQTSDVARMFDVINEAIARNPPAGVDAAALEAHRAVGICGAACRWADMSPAVQARWRSLVPTMIARLKTALDASRRDRPRVNGWLPFRLPRSFGTNYAMRAGSAANSGGIFGLEGTEATYFMALTDAQDETLGQGRRYRLHLPAGGLPADAFWSVTLYEFQAGGQYMTPNAINRYAISDRTQGLVRNADGSLDIWIQPHAPVDPRERANWLPSPADNKFYLNARIYQPRAEVLDPNWQMPPLQRQLP